MKRSLGKRIQKAVTSPTSKTKDLEPQKEIIKFYHQPSKSVSCPSLKHSRTTAQSLALRHTASVVHISEEKSFIQKCRLLSNCMEVNVLQIRMATTDATEKSVNALKNIGSVCACPAPNTCLPPPCNTPAKCIQYMTGYYYYPYGTWFCGPYHVSTGSCPCAGPVKPGDACGPLCCKPLSCCGVCGVSGTNQNNNTNNAYNSWQFGSANMYSSYNPHPSNPYVEYSFYNHYNTYTPYGYYNGFNGTQPNFGPCYNVPITPIPVTHPMTSKSCHTQTYTNNSAPKSSISWALSKANINQDTKVSSSKNDVGNVSSTKNLNPKSLRYYPYSSQDSKPSLSKTNPYTKPRINARTLQTSNSIGTCYFSTKYIGKNSKKGRKLTSNTMTNDIRPKKSSFVHHNYWYLFGNEKNTKEQT